MERAAAWTARPRRGATSESASRPSAGLADAATSSSIPRAATPACRVSAIPCRYPDHPAERQLPISISSVALDQDGVKILKLSVYSEMVWGQRKVRAMRRGRPIDWMMRNLAVQPGMHATSAISASCLRPAGEADRIPASPRLHRNG